MSIETSAIDPELWKVIESTITDRYSNMVERETRLIIERARLPLLPLSLDINVKVTDPVAIWRMIQFAEELQALPGSGETMLVLQKVMPKIVAWGLESAHNRLTETRKETNTTPPAAPATP